MTNAMWKKFFNFIKNAMKKGGDMALANRPLRAILLTSLFAVLGVLDAYNAKYLVGSEELISLEAWLGGLLAFWGVLLLARRTANQDKQLTIQINKEIDDRFIAAVTLLGSRESSARTGAIYSLYHLAIESEKYRKQIAQILCSHIRSKTQEESYQKDHERKPSNEIQTTIDLLFKNVNGVKGLYCLDFSQVGNLPRAILSRAYLCGADFRKAECCGVGFGATTCHHAKFNDAECQNADFSAALCTAANFEESQCQGADFSFSQCYGAYFSQSICEDANFAYARCQGAYFGGAYLPYANFSFANCQGACFMIGIDEIGKAIFYGADFHGAHSNSMDELEKRIEKDTEIKNVLDGSKLTLERANVGVLEDTEEIREIIAKIKKWRGF